MRWLTSRHPKVVETAVTLPAGGARGGLASTHGARVIDSTPPATATSTSPVSIAREAIIAASRLDPHNRLTVVAGTPTGRPASSTAILPTLRLSSPAPLALPHTTSSTKERSSAGALSSTPDSAVAARSSGRISARAPPNRPNGVRAAAYRNDAVTGLLLARAPARCPCRDLNLDGRALRGSDGGAAVSCEVGDTRPCFDNGKQQREGRSAGATDRPSQGRAH